MGETNKVFCLQKIKKIEKIVLDAKFKQKALLTEKAFIQYCKEREVNISRETLDFLEEKGLFRPVIILKITSGIYLDYESLQYYKKHNLISPFSKSTEQGKNITKVYHPYQIILLDVILISFGCYLSPSVTLGKTSRATKAISKYMSINKKRIKLFRKRNLGFYLDIFVLLFSVENNYLPDIRCNFRGGESDYADWFASHKKFKITLTVRNLKLSGNFIKRAYEQLDTHVHFLDPLHNWYSLARYIPIRKREKLKGKALLAQLYYEILDILRAVYSELGCQDNLLGNYEAETKWLEGIVKKKINYEDFDVLELLLNSFGLNPSPKVFVFVEGDTEYAVIHKLLEMANVSIESNGIKIKNFGGVDKFNIKRLSDLLEYLMSKGTDCFFILDPEGKYKTQKNKLESKFPSLKTNITIWSRDFERDNFTNKEIAEGLSEYSQEIEMPCATSIKEIIRSKTIRNLFCGKLNGCSEMLTCGRSSEGVATCSKNIYRSDKLNKPAFGKLLTSKYLAPQALKSKKKHPALTKGIIKVFNEIIRHASARVVNERP